MEPTKAARVQVAAPSYFLPQHCARLAPGQPPSPVIEPSGAARIRVAAPPGTSAPSAPHRSKPPDG
eukprot:631642-Pelagomonas_calceolata.AAC.8